MKRNFSSKLFNLYFFEMEFHFKKYLIFTLLFFGMEFHFKKYLILICFSKGIPFQKIFNSISKNIESLLSYIQKLTVAYDQRQNVDNFLLITSYGIFSFFFMLIISYGPFLFYFFDVDHRLWFMLIFFFRS